MYPKKHKTEAQKKTQKKIDLNRNACHDYRAPPIALFFISYGQQPVDCERKRGDVAR